MLNEQVFYKNIKKLQSQEYEAVIHFFVKLWEPFSPNLVGEGGL